MGILKDKSYRFAVRIVRLVRFVQGEHKEYVLSRQVLRSGTAIGALIREAEFAQSKADFVHKMQIALKEANETGYWLSLMKDTEYLTAKMYDSIHPEIEELIKMLVKTIKTTKENTE